MIDPGRGPLRTVTRAGRGAGCGAGEGITGAGHEGSGAEVVGGGRCGRRAPSATASSGTGVAGSTRKGVAAGSAWVDVAGIVVVSAGSGVGPAVGSGVGPGAGSGVGSAVGSRNSTVGSGVSLLLMSLLSAGF